MGMSWNTRHLLISFALFALSVFYISSFKSFGTVLGATTSNYTDDKTEQKVQVKTQTAFDQKEIYEVEDIIYKTLYEKNPDAEYGTEEVTQPGVLGKRILTYLLTYWQNETIDKQLVKTEIQEPLDEKISTGTKIVWQIYATPDIGRIKYWQKMRVWATKYDGNCEGCSGRTYSGTEVKKGVCATDPKVIPLGTNFYVEGYGICRAEDIGGMIKRKHIDLGYVDASKGEWRTGFTDIYLLTSAPAE